MNCMLCGPFKRMLERAGFRSCKDGFDLYWERARAWDRAQVDDEPLFTRDPHIEEFRAARAIEKTDPAGCFHQLLALAEGGSACSMLAVGWRYFHGDGVEADEARSRDWYRRAAEAGSQYAQIYFGRSCLWDGQYAEAEKVFAMGAREDWAPALYWLAISRLRQSADRRGYIEAFPLIERAAAKGSLYARCSLATEMARGRFGLRHLLRGLRLKLALCHEILKILEGEQQPASRQDQPVLPMPAGVSEAPSFGRAGS